MIEIVRKGLDTCFYADGIQLARAVGKEGCRDSFEEREEGVYLWRRECAPVQRMQMELRASFTPDFTMIPGVNYNGNGWGTFCEYTSDRYHGEPWKYGYHRAAVACMTYSEKKVEGKVRAAALFGLENDDNCCQLYEDNGEEVHRICWPEEETPKKLELYRFSEGWHGSIEPRDSFTAWIVLEENGVRRSAYARALDAAWKRNDRERKLPLDRRQVWELAVSYAKQLYTEEEDGFCGFSIGYSWNGEKWEKRTSNKYEIGWCGQNGMLANALLYEALRSGDREAEKMGFAVLDSWLTHAISPAGVVASYYDPQQVRYLEACDLGTAGCAYFEAADLTERLKTEVYLNKISEEESEGSSVNTDVEKAGRREAAYRQAAFDICDFALRVQDEEGRFAKCWMEDGTVAVREGTVGAFLVLPLIEGFRRSGREEYKEAAVRSLSFYLRELEENGFTTAGALDIFSIDKESSIPLLKGAVALYELTGEKRWLEGAKAAAWYLSTWQYTHTCRFGQECILGQTGYDSFGGTLVSTVHEGIDPFALCYIPELYLLGKITGEERWISRARAIWGNGCQHISDGNLVVDGKRRPVGSQDESYTVTRQGERGHASQWLVAWPGSFRMEVLRRIGEEADAEKILGE